MLLPKWFPGNFAPALAREVRSRLYTPLGILVSATVIAALCGLVVHPRVFALAGGLGVVVAVGVCWPWLTLRGCTASIHFDGPRGREGETVDVFVTVTNSLPWPAWGLSIRGGMGRDGLLPLDAIPARSKSKWTWRFTPAIRGVYPVSPVSLSTGFPFGVWEPQRVVTVAKPFIVWPATVPVGPVPISPSGSISDGHTARTIVGSMGDFVGIRPYRRGDSPRRIHWGQTAKHDRFIVCEVAASIRPRVMIRFDNQEAIHTPGPEGTFEWAIRTVASLAEGWIADGVEVGYEDRTTTIRPAAGHQQIAAILDRLAAIVATDEPGRPAATSIAGVASFVVTTDRAKSSNIRPGERTILLATTGFHGGDETSIRGFTPWLEIADREQYSRQLHRGWSEARHGS